MLLTEPTASAGETWGEHAATALGFAWCLQLASIAAPVQAVLPFLFVKTASTMIT